MMSHTGGNAGGGGGGGGSEGGGGGDGGGGDNSGGDDGGGGSGGGEGGWNCATKDSFPRFFPANEKLCPKPDAAHSAPFQPSASRLKMPTSGRPRSVMFRVHVAPIATANGKLEAYGAPPLSVVPSEQLSLQPTSSGK